MSAEMLSSSAARNIFGIALPVTIKVPLIDLDWSIIILNITDAGWGVSDRDFFLVRSSHQNKIHIIGFYWKGCEIWSLEINQQIK